MTGSYIINKASPKRQHVMNIVIMLLLFLTTLNFVTRYYYWIYIAFGVFLLTPKRKMRMNVSTVFLLLLAMSMLLFDIESRSSITNMIKPFVFMIAYTIGFGFSDKNSENGKNVKNLEYIIYLCAFGFLTHYLLNLITNFGALERNTIDIWTDSVLSATSQASLASMSVGIVAAFLFSKTSQKNKIFAIILCAIIILYNLILAGRTLLFLMAIIFVLAFLYRSIHYKVNILKGVLILAIIATVLSIIYNMDLFGIKTAFEDSNFYWRFFARENTSITRDSRFRYKLLFLDKMMDYPFGGTHLRGEYRVYAHDLYLDAYDQYSIFALAGIVGYMISSLIRLVKCLRLPTLPFYTKQLIFCVYVTSNIQFLLEPILQGMPWLFIAYCLIDGSVAHLLATKPKTEVTNAG